MRKSYLTGLMLAGLTIVPHDNIHEKYVEWGTATYSYGAKLRSNSFSACSAVILDSGNEAVMIHAFPQTLHRYSRRGISDALRIDAFDAPKEAVRELTLRGAYIGKAEAVVNAGSRQSHDTIVEGFRELGIKVRHSEVSDRERDIVYNPVNNFIIL